MGRGGTHFKRGGGGASNCQSFPTRLTLLSEETVKTIYIYIYMRSYALSLPMAGLNTV